LSLHEDLFIQVLVDVDAKKPRCVLLTSAENVPWEERHSRAAASAASCLESTGIPIAINKDCEAIGYLLGFGRYGNLVNLQIVFRPIYWVHGHIDISRPFETEEHVRIQNLTETIRQALLNPPTAVS